MCGCCKRCGRVRRPGRQYSVCARVTAGKSDLHTSSDRSATLRRCPSPSPRCSHALRAEGIAYAPPHSDLLTLAVACKCPQTKPVIGCRRGLCFRRPAITDAKMLLEIVNRTLQLGVNVGHNRYSILRHNACGAGRFERTLRLACEVLYQRA